MWIRPRSAPRFSVCPPPALLKRPAPFTNSSRVISWKEKAVDPPGQAKVDSEIISRLFLKIRELYAKDGGALPEPVAALTWNYLNPSAPSPTEVLREINGRALTDLLAPPDPRNPDAPRAVQVRAGEQLGGFALLRDDGSTSCGNWIYCGSFGPTGNLTQRRDNTDPTGLGVFPNWGFSWPANRRILYNRASADANGKPWDPSRKYLSWNGTWAGGADIPDIRPDAAPEQNVGAFIMNPEGVARLHAALMM